MNVLDCATDTSTHHTYNRLSKTGNCGIYEDGKHYDLYEHCQCDRLVFPKGAICKNFCDTDSCCKGYEYERSSCIIYTIAPCPTECQKRNVGHRGNMINTPADIGSGCFIKQR